MIRTTVATATAEDFGELGPDLGCFVVRTDSVSTVSLYRSR